MPLRRHALTGAAVAQLSAAMFEPSPQRCIGLEVEWFVHRHDDVAACPSSDDISRFEGAVLPVGGRISFKPGGQAELSIAPAQCVSQALHAAEVDTRALDLHMQAAGFVCETLAVNARRPPRRSLNYHHTEDEMSTTISDRQASWDTFADACITHDPVVTGEQRILELLMRADRERLARTAR